MKNLFCGKAVLSVSVLAIGLTAAGSVHAQALYQPYYYVQREQYQTMPSAPVRPLPPSPNYPPDDRLTPRTNQALAQGNPPPPPPQPKLVPVPSTLPLTTRAGFDLGIGGSYYKYSEDIGVHDNGYKIGFLGSGTATFGENMFATVDFRYGLGQVDYSSASGKLSGLTDDLWEIRGLFGRDFLYRDLYSIAPFTGFGYRELYNDARGTTDLGAQGYQRTSDYMYIPIGIKPRARLTPDSRVSMSVEYDYFIHGEEASNLSDAGFGDPNIKNQQSSGYGLQGNLMYEQDDWSVGPFFNYWNIDNSKAKIYTSPNATCGATTCSAIEPQNQTIEVGFQFKWHFPVTWMAY